MGNILFQNQPKQANSVLAQVNEMRSSGPSSTVFSRMYNTNPQFRQFADNLRGKTPEQAFRENGLDFNNFKNLKW